MRRKHRQFRCVDEEITPKLLAIRCAGLNKMGFPKPKWIQFCETLLAGGFTLTMYEAKQTCSKYITVSLLDFTPFRVRFSNHKPNIYRQRSNDCDFFVGVNNFGVTTTEQALVETVQWFRKQVSDRMQKAEQEASGEAPAAPDALTQNVRNRIQAIKQGIHSHG